MGSKPNGLGVTTRAAFFDVDETLISTKSMFVFLRYWIECRDGDADAYQQLVAGIHALAENGAPGQRSTECTTGSSPVFPMLICSLQAGTGTASTASCRPRSSVPRYLLSPNIGSGGPHCLGFRFLPSLS